MRTAIARSESSVVSSTEPPKLESFLAAYHAASEEYRRAGLKAAMAALTGQTKESSGEELLTARSLADRLDIVPSTVWRWRFPYVDWLGRKRYRLSDCQAYLQSDAFQLRRLALRSDRNRQDRQQSRAAQIRG